MAVRISEDRQRDIVKVWEQQRKHAMSAKKEYMDTAREASRYYAGPHDFVFERLEGGAPTFKVTINKVFEMLKLFGPMTYAQNPARNVDPRTAGNPIITEALKAYLNYTPWEFGLKDSSKKSIDEGLLNGRGALFTGIDGRSGYVRTASVNTRDILIDPEADTWYAGDYIMRLRRNRPLWRFARMFGKEAAQALFDRGVKAGQVNHSFDFGSALDPDAWADDSDYKRDSTLEMMGHEVPRVSWIEVYSKMGVGLREKKSDTLDFIGDSDSEDYLLLIYEPTSKLLLYVGPWPIPFWADVDKSSWPFSFVDPAENADKIWPISLIKPALGEQMFLDWGYSYAMGFIQASSRCIGITTTPTNSKLEAAFKSNQGITIVPLPMDAGKTVTDLLQILQMPRLTPDLLAMLKEVELLFEKRTGMNEILYGTSQKVMRSATEAEMKAQYSRMRIDDIIDKVEDWQSMVARKEAFGARLVLGADKMLPLVGQDMAIQWDQLRGGSLEQIVREYDYTVVSGSTRKRTPQAHIDSATMMYDRMAQLRIMIGDIPGYNMIEQELLKAHSVPNPEKFILGSLPSPEQQQGGQGAQGEQQPPEAPQIVKVENGEPVYSGPTGLAS